MTVHPGYWAAAAKVCSDAELEALVHRDMLGRSTRTIAMVLGISRWAVRDRLESADRKIAATRKDAA